jgi:L-ribulose-5-phosphate 3-epimerase
MDRRTVLQWGAATLATSALAQFNLAQNTTSSAAQPRKLHVDAYSRTLHWLRTPGEVAEACHQIGNTTIDLTVRVYPGHVAPEKVKIDLPPFVNGLKRSGITVTCMAAEITDADTPYVEAMLDTASSLGIHHHWWRGFTIDASKPYMQQLDAFKPRVAGLVKLEEKYGTKAMYHPGGGFSSAFFDILYVLKDFDPRFVSVQYDTGNLLQTNQQNLVTQLRMGAPYIGGFVFKDAIIEPNPTADPNSPATAAGAGRGGGGGRGGQQGRFRNRQVPVGTGIINLPLIAQTLKEINFNGPMECQPEWPELGGADQGRDTITIPRERVIELLRRDRLTVEAAFAGTNLL